MNERKPSKEARTGPPVTTGRITRIQELEHIKRMNADWDWGLFYWETHKHLSK